MHRRACKQYIFRSYNISFQCFAFWWKSFHVPVRKKERKKKGLRVSNFALLLIVLIDIMAVKGLSNNNCLLMWLQVNCIEMSTNSGTVRKQVRETLKQLQKDKKVVRHVLRDLDLDNSCVRMVMALPNITSELLKQRLEPTTVKVKLGVLPFGFIDTVVLRNHPLPAVEASYSSRWHWFDSVVLTLGIHKITHFCQSQLYFTVTLDWRCRFNVTNSQKSPTSVKVSYI